jgi:two-component system, cell cycle response regulator DivK
MKKIALIEDNPDNRLLIRVLLRENYELAEYESGTEAWVGLQAQTPDLVLLDISLPDMDGAELLQRIRADERLRQLPVIAVTAHAMRGDQERLLAAGFDGYVTKPIVDFSLLFSAIEQALQK